jgi:nuclear protein localization family protein 4
MLNKHQDEEILLCKVAAEHDLSEGLQLQSSDAWQTLLMVLKDTGERPQKRSYNSTLGGGAHPHEHSHNPLRRAQGQPSSDSDTTQLAKRIKGVNLKGK